MTPEVRQALFDQAELFQAHPKWGFKHFINTNPRSPRGEEGPVYGQDETNAQRGLEAPPYSPSIEHRVPCQVSPQSATPRHHPATRGETRSARGVFSPSGPLALLPQRSVSPKPI